MKGMAKNCCRKPGAQGCLFHTPNCAKIYPCTSVISINSGDFIPGPPVKRVRGEKGRKVDGQSRRKRGGRRDKGKKGRELNDKWRR